MIVGNLACIGLSYPRILNPRFGADASKSHMHGKGGRELGVGMYTLDKRIFEQLYRRALHVHAY